MWSPPDIRSALGKDAEVNTVVLLPVNHGVHSPVDVQQDTVVAAPVCQSGVGGEASSQIVVHDDGHFEFFGELSPLQHFFTGGGGDS